MQDEITAHPIHWSFSVALNNNVYFGSQASGVRGRTDIYVAKFDGEKYAAPEDMGTAINSDGDDVFCFAIDASVRYTDDDGIDGSDRNAGREM